MTNGIRAVEVERERKRAKRKGKGLRESRVGESRRYGRRRGSFEEILVMHWSPWTGLELLLASVPFTS